MKNKKWGLLPVSILCLLLIVLVLVSAEVFGQTDSRMYVRESSVIWNPLRDFKTGDNVTSGIAGFGLYLFDGTNNDRARGDTTYGLDVDVTRLPPNGGTAFYAIKHTTVTSAASINLAFGFTSRIVVLEVPYSNTQDIVVDWLGGTAAAPAADTAGDDIIPPGRTVTYDDYAISSISVIAGGAGNQTVYVRAYQ